MKVSFLSCLFLLFLLAGSNGVVEGNEDEPGAVSTSLSLFNSTAFNSTVDARDLESGSGFCWLHSYGRGAGKVPTDCADGKERVGALCYEECPVGYARGVKYKTIDCYQKCPNATVLDDEVEDLRWIDDGLYCRLTKKKGSGGSHFFGTYGRGWGFTTKSLCKDKADDFGVDDCERCLAFWYPKCKAGYKNVGCNLCSPDPKCDDYGMGKRIASSCTKKIWSTPPKTGTTNAN